MPSIKTRTSVQSARFAQPGEGNFRRARESLDALAKCRAVVAVPDYNFAARRISGSSEERQYGRAGQCHSVGLISTCEWPQWPPAGRAFFVLTNVSLLVFCNYSALSGSRLGVA